MTRQVFRRFFVAVLLLVAAAVTPPAHAAGDDQPTLATQRHRVWLDVDPANGIGEIDDGLAMIQAFHSPLLKPVGVSVVYGNTALKQAHPIALNVTRSFGPEGLDVHPGAASAKELGQTTPAVTAMAQALEEGPMTILALGPVTNVATLLQKHPELSKRIMEIVVVAGRRSVDQAFLSHPDQPEPFSDFNFEHDPAAMQVLLDSDVPLALAPWEVSSHIWITRDDLAQLRASGGSGLWIAATSQHWIEMWENELGAKGFNPFDTLAVGYLTHPTMIERMRVTAEIKRAAADVPGPQNAARKPYLVVDRANNPSRRIVYLHTPKPAFKDVLLKRLAGPAEMDP
jgi:pyrimidine-specific ribonucleoside hydrolase